MTSTRTDNTPSTLEFTGERFVPEIEGSIALEHLHRYLIARELARSKVILDIACGEGYGSAMLAGVGSRVLGVDISAEAVAHARRKYVNENLEFYEGCADAIPLPKGSVDLVVSFETIEHHDKHAEMMAEIHRVLRTEGLLVMSSPDKREFSDVTGYSNPFHVKELYLDEFKSLLEQHFQNVAILGQRICYGSVIASDHADEAFSSFVEQDGVFTREGGIPRPRYFVAVASNAPLPVLGTSFYEDNVEHSDAVGARDREIAELIGVATTRQSQHDEVVNRLTGEVNARDRGIAELIRVTTTPQNQHVEVVNRLTGEVNARDREIAELLGVAATRRNQHDEVVNRLTGEVNARDHQIAALNQALAERDQQLGALWESTSWRVTKPLRSIRRELQRFFRVM